jgi:addiction module RelB/DinJ family antitoxin
MKMARQAHHKTVIYIKADKEVKENAQKAAKDLGLSLSDVINASLRNFIRTRQVIFSDTPIMTPELEKLLDTVEDDIKYNRNIVGPFSSAREMDEYLDRP